MSEEKPKAELTVTIEGITGDGKTTLALALIHTLNALGATVLAEEEIIDEQQRRKADNWAPAETMLRELVMDRGLQVTIREKRTCKPGTAVRMYLSIVDTASGPVFQVCVGDESFGCAPTTESVQQLAGSVATRYPAAYIQHSSSINHPEDYGLAEDLDLGEVFAEAYGAAKGAFA